MEFGIKNNNQTINLPYLHRYIFKNIKLIDLTANLNSHEVTIYNEPKER